MAGEGAHASWDSSSEGRGGAGATTGASVGQGGQRLQKPQTDAGRAQPDPGPTTRMVGPTQSLGHPICPALALLIKSRSGGWIIKGIHIQHGKFEKHREKNKENVDCPK